MRFAKLKSTGRVIASLSGGEGADDLNKFASELGYPIDEMDIGYEDDAVVEGWFLAQDTAALTYKDKRVDEYPSIGDQLDALYHAGTFDSTMTAAIKAVKDKYPKP
jgi:hypothetical protein